MARSLATATVRPSGWKEAWLTQDATMALRALLYAAVTTYSPVLMRAIALATSPAHRPASQDVSLSARTSVCQPVSDMRYFGQSVQRLTRNAT